jgi:aminoglycoside phosphotransferase (APT) family kinase protein
MVGGTSWPTLLLYAPPRSGRIVARHDTGVGPLADTPFTLRREADTFAALAGTDVPVPAVIAVAADDRSFAVDEVAGSVDRDATALDDYLRTLAMLHDGGLTHVPTDHPGFDRAGSEDLDIWVEIATTRIRRPAPLLEIAFTTLDRHAASAPTDPTLCHGDAGFGNYLCAGSRVTGLVDWEMAHTGDPHDDLASIAVRAALTGIDLGDYRARVGWHWEPASGRRFDPQRYLVGVVATLTKMVISCVAALDNPRPDIDRTTQLMGLPLMELHLLRALAALEGERVEQPPTIAPDADFVAEVDRLLAEQPAADASDPGLTRRRAYLAEQRRLTADTAPMTTTDEPPEVQVLARLAALPASRSLMRFEIAGIDR